MAKKQFKIGECAIGGIIAVDINGQDIKVEALDYNTKKIVCHRTFNQLDFQQNVELYIDDYLNSLTTSYYAGKVLDWIKTKFKF